MDGNYVERIKDFINLSNIRLIINLIIFNKRRYPIFQLSESVASAISRNSFRDSINKLKPSKNKI